MLILDVSYIYQIYKSIMQLFIKTHILLPVFLQIHESCVMHYYKICIDNRFYFVSLQLLIPGCESCPYNDEIKLAPNFQHLVSKVYAGRKSEQFLQMQRQNEGNL